MGSIKVNTKICLLLGRLAGSAVICLEGAFRAGQSAGLAGFSHGIFVKAGIAGIDTRFCLKIQIHGARAIAEVARKYKIVCRIACGADCIRSTVETLEGTLLTGEGISVILLKF